MNEKPQHNRLELSNAFPEDVYTDPIVRIPSREEFWLRVASTKGARADTAALIQRRYEWRGYLDTKTDHAPAEHSMRDEFPDDIYTPSKMTLAVYDKHQHVVGTITAKTDHAGLNAETVFSDVLTKYRQEGIRMGEFSALAIDANLDRSVLGALFHSAYIFLARIHQSDMCIIEINPRHVRYYEHAYGFKQLAQPRPCTRVNAPAVLMGADCSYINREVFRMGGTYNPQNRATRSIYPYFFDAKEELGVAKRLFSDIVPIHHNETFEQRFARGD